MIGLFSYTQYYNFITLRNKFKFCLEIIYSTRALKCLNLLLTMIYITLRKNHTQKNMTSVMLLCSNALDNIGLEMQRHTGKQSHRCVIYYISLLSPPDKNVSLGFIFVISQPKYMLWVLKRTVSLRRFFLALKT